MVRNTCFISLLVLVVTSLTSAQHEGSGHPQDNPPPVPPGQDNPPPVPPGHPKPYNTTLKDPLVQFAVQMINVFYLHSGDNPHTPLSILNAQVRVVQGWLYDFSLEMRDEHLKQNAVCNMSVLHRPWMNDTDQQFGLINCTDSDRRYPPPPGHPVPYNTTLSDAKVVYAVKCINEYFRSHGDDKTRTAVKLVNATVQVATGQVFRFAIQVTDSVHMETCDVTLIHKPGVSTDVTELGQPTCSKEPATYRNDGLTFVDPENRYV